MRLWDEGTGSVALALDADEFTRGHRLLIPGPQGDLHRDPDAATAMAAQNGRRPTEVLLSAEREELLALGAQEHNACADGAVFGNRAHPWKPPEIVRLKRARIMLDLRSSKRARSCHGAPPLYVEQEMELGRSGAWRKVTPYGARPVVTLFHMEQETEFVLLHTELRGGGGRAFGPQTRARDRGPPTGNSPPLASLTLIQAFSL